MKKLAVSLLLIALCSAALAQNSYTIKGTVPVDNNGKKVYLYDHNSGKYIDSTIVADGAFVLKNQIDEPAICRLSIHNAYRLGDIIVENRNIAINYSDDDVLSVKADGLNAPYAEILDYQAYMATRAQFIRDSLGRIYGEDYQAFRKVYQPLYTQMTDQLQQLYDKGMKSNTDNVFGVYCVWQLIDYRAKTLVQLDSLMAIVPSAAIFVPLKRRHRLLAAYETTDAGAMFQDFAATTADGKPAKLSDYVGKGKYVLIDFWASWCGPCLGEVPNLRYLHETYPELVVVGINVWDEHDRYLASLAKENMTWASLYASHDRVATDTYGIRMIPTIILFAPDGTIVSRELRDKYMLEFVAKTLQK